MKKCAFLLSWCITLSVLCIPVAPPAAADTLMLSDGQRLYVPAYSHIYSGNREMPFNLAVTLSIRNINPEHPIRLTTVDYHETRGALIKSYLETPVTLKPLESVRYIIPEKDKTGGSGANFIVAWDASVPVNPPIVESIMISTQSQQGISFTSRSQEIIEIKKNTEVKK